MGKKKLIVPGYASANDDNLCRFDGEHGRCQHPAAYSDQPTGGGRWCREHWFRVMGWPQDKPQTGKKHPTWRDRWYSERGVPFEKANLHDCPPFQCVGSTIPNRFIRQPGEDTDAEVNG